MHLLSKPIKPLINYYADDARECLRLNRQMEIKMMTSINLYEEIHLAPILIVPMFHVPSCDQAGVTSVDPRPNSWVNDRSG